jgi:hypothetical protein
MKNPQLFDYIKKQIDQGVSLDTIKDSLLKQNWSKEDIEENMSQFSEKGGVAPTGGAKKKKFFSWLKGNVEEDEAYAPYEEIDSKKTSRLGYFFLVLMVFFGVWQGNNFLWALEDTISAPEHNSYCFSTLVSYADENIGGSVYEYDSNYGYNRGYTDYDKCNFSAREVSFGVKNLYEQVLPTIAQIKSAVSNITELNNQISNKRYNRNQTASDYEVSLLEKIANSNGTAFDRNALKSGVISADEQIANLERILAKEQAREQSLTNSVRSAVTSQKDILEKTASAYQHDFLVYQFEQFLVRLLFVAPVFFFLWRRYHASKAKRSEYSVIWGGMVATVSIIFAQVIIVFVYEILPRKILQEIFAILAQIKIVWATLYWLGFILVPLFFGWLIYLIQKKFYNKRAVLMRALKSGHCPNCSLKVDQFMNHCPVCGYALKTKCNSCGQMSMEKGAYCDHCGVRKI